MTPESYDKDALQQVTFSLNPVVAVDEGRTSLDSFLEEIRDPNNKQTFRVNFPKMMRDGSMSFIEKAWEFCAERFREEKDAREYLEEVWAVATEAEEQQPRK